MLKIIASITVNDQSFKRNLFGTVSMVIPAHR